MTITAPTPTVRTASIARAASTVRVNAERAREAVLSAVRLVVGFLFACHGAVGLFGLFGGIDTQGTAVPVLQWPGWYASVIELVTGVLVAVGLYTRSAAVLASGTMAYAYFTVHAPEGFFPIENMGEPAAMYSWVFLLIAVAGPGSVAVDRLRRR